MWPAIRLAQSSHSHWPQLRQRTDASRDGWLAQCEVTRIAGEVAAVRGDGAAGPS